MVVMQTYVITNHVCHLFAVTQGARKLQQLGNLVTQNPVTTLAGAAIGSAQSAFNNATSGVRNAINETRAGVTNRTNAAVAEGQGLVGG